tara:strand:- start:1440 stop:2321 length:882 start_codon:yes stop_codon:yes gene_type:complete
MSPITLGEYKEFLPIYFHDEYIAIQNDQILVFKNEHFHTVITQKNEVGYSFRQSPFGSFFLKNSANLNLFLAFESQITQKLKQENIKKVILRQPPAYYDGFVSHDWLESAGYTHKTQDVNQYIPLTDHPEENLHKMEFRKLKNAEKEGLLFSHDPVSSLEEIHAFIAYCRSDVGLTVNITLDKLKSLFTTFPASYDLYSIRRNNEILAACVVSKPLPDIYYYYLPATHPDHKSKSPMVLLMVSLMESLTSKGAKLLDLGLSSIDGKKQSGLYAFKKRMGAKETASLVYEKDLD